MGLPLPQNYISIQARVRSTASVSNLLKNTHRSARKAIVMQKADQSQNELLPFPPVWTARQYWQQLPLGESGHPRRRSRGEIITNL